MWILGELVSHSKRIRNRKEKAPGVSPGKMKQNVEQHRQAVLRGMERQATGGGSVAASQSVVSVTMGAMIATHAPTVEDWIAAHGERCEFVRGEALEKPLANGNHSDAQVTLSTELTLWGRRTGGGKVRSEWHHRFGSEEDTRVYVPDLVFVLAPAHLDLPSHADRASDIMIEIASPGQGVELTDKVEFYLHHGARRVWVVDPQRRCVGVYSPDAAPRTFAGDAVLTDALLPGFSLRLSELFAG